MKSAVIGVVSALTLALIASPAHASESEVVEDPVVAVAAPSEGDLAADGYEITAEDEAQLAALVAATDGDSLAFDVDAARAAGATDQSVSDYAAVLAGAGWSISGQVPAVESALNADLSRAGAEIMACRGQNGYTGFHGIFWQWALNSCNTDVLITLAGAGPASVSAIGGMMAAAAVPPGAIIAATGAIMALGIIPLIACKNASGNAAIYVNIFPTGAGCWGQ